MEKINTLFFSLETSESTIKRMINKDSNYLTIYDRPITIEDIISKMQSDRITLEQSFELYNKGLSLVQDCNNQIEKIEKQIKIIEEGNINE